MIIKSEPVFYWLFKHLEFRQKSLSSLFEYPDETLSLVFDMLLTILLLQHISVDIPDLAL